MFQTLGTLFRARAAEAEETLIDRNAITLLAQHLRDAKAEIGRSRAAIAGLMARETERGRGLDKLAEEILRREREAQAAMEAGEDALAADELGTSRVRCGAAASEAYERPLRGVARWLDGETVDVNVATAVWLEALPQVGPARVIDV